VKFYEIKMSYYPEIEKKERDILETKLQTLEELPSGLPIQLLNVASNGNTNVFLESMTYKENLSILSRIRASNGNYTLDSYFESGGSLALRYKFDTFNLLLYCSDTASALEIISKGKCHIVSTQQSPQQMVVCNVEEEAVSIEN
tara:strand:- start:128 stop:559 length:432 start_codon:yes stop_codon:yes gene_type:complete